jgi:hypothetical protein
MLESIAADIRQPSQPQGAMDKAHQLIPIQKFLTGLKSDVKETSAAIKGVSKGVAVLVVVVGQAVLVFPRAGSYSCWRWLMRCWVV